MQIEENTKSCVSEIQSSTDIHYIRGYASALFILAKYINSHNYEILNVKGILTTADILYPSYREEIEKAFNCFVYDQYGSGEIHAIAGQCDKVSLYHVFDEHVIVENKVTSETEKNALITDLDNYAWEAGIKLSLANSNIQVFIPLVNSKDLKNISDDFHSSFSENIRFSINLNAFNPPGILENRI